MALYFIITFLFLVLVPLTLSLSRPATQSKMDMNACQCQECIDQRAHIRKQERGPLFLPKLGRKCVMEPTLLCLCRTHESMTRTMFVIGGWALFAFLSYKVSNIKSDEKVYDPFEILEISRVSLSKLRVDGGSLCPSCRVLPRRRSSHGTRSSPSSCTLT